MLGLKNIRIPSYDYQSDGYYFVTIVTRFRQTFFANQQNCQNCKIIIHAAVKAISGASIDTMIIMPDHAHLIIDLHNAKLPLGEIMRRIKAKTSYEFKERLWQPNYYEHVIRSYESLENIRAYIINNPNSMPKFIKHK